MIKHLYIHVPFCKTICSYCDFCHRIYDEKNADLYLKRIEEEFKECKDEQYSTIYIGGGTPSSLTSSQLDKLLSFTDAHLKEIEEFTVEVNPESINEEKIDILVKHKVNRISMGLQSSNEDELKLMNRHHSFLDVKEKVALFKQKGINNISIDIIYSLPNQTMSSLKKTIDDALSLDVPHISLYSLTIEENSVFGKKGYQTCNEDIEADMYEYIVSTLENNGYRQYEIANFAKTDFRSKHNLGYWHYDDYRSLGPGSTSKIDHQRIEKTRNIKAYLDSVKLIDNIDVLTNEDEAFENIMMSLRLEEGLNLKTFYKRYGFNPLEYYKEVLNKHKNDFMIKNDFLICTKREILNTILVDFLL